MHLVKIDDAVVAVKIGLQNAAQKTRPPTLAPQPRVVLDPSTANQPPQALTQSSLNDLTQASAGSHTSIFGTDDAGSPVEKEGNPGSVVFLPPEELAALLRRRRKTARVLMADMKQTADDVTRTWGLVAAGPLEPVGVAFFLKIFEIAPEALRALPATVQPSPNKRDTDSHSCGAQSSSPSGTSPTWRSRPSSRSMPCP